MDEQNSPLPGHQGNAAPAAVRQLIERLLKVPGVTQAVVSDKSGIPVDEQSDKAQELATTGKLLIEGALLAGKTMGVGETKNIAMQDKNYQMLVYASKSQYLHVSVKKEIKLSLVEAEINRILAAGR